VQFSASAYRAGKRGIGERGIDRRLAAVRGRGGTGVVCGRLSAFMRQRPLYLSPKNFVARGLLECGVRRRRGGDHARDEGKEDDTVRFHDGVGL
jgi:hypothetical protein